MKFVVCVGAVTGLEGNHAMFTLIGQIMFVLFLWAYDRAAKNQQHVL